MTLLRELIEIPDHVQKGDFVLRLSEGVIDPAGTLGEYVVTPELVKCFDQALDFVRARHVVGDPTSDYGRIHRQQLFLSALLRQSLSAGTLLDLGKLQALVGAVGRSTYGENIEADQLLSLGQSLSGIDARHVTFTTVPTTGVANDPGNAVRRAADDRSKKPGQALQDAFPGWNQCQGQRVLHH